MLVAADPQLRETLSAPSNLRLIRRCTHLEIDTPRDTTSAAAYTLRLLARRIGQLTSEIHNREHQITTTVTNGTARLLTRPGIGPDNAALLITAGDNPDRLRGEASFAALCGVSPPRDVLKRYGATDLFYSFGTAHPGSVTLHNHPRFMQQLRRDDGMVVDLAAIDILRSRERGVPRYNEFRRLLRLPEDRSFDDLNQDPQAAAELATVYDSIEASI